MKFDEDLPGNDDPERPQILQQLRTGVTASVLTEAMNPDVCVEDDPFIPDTQARRFPRESGGVLP